MHIVVACSVVANAICVIVHNFLSTLCSIFTPARSLYVFLQSFCQLDSYSCITSINFLPAPCCTLKITTNDYMKTKTANRVNDED